MRMTVKDKLIRVLNEYKLLCREICGKSLYEFMQETIRDVEYGLKHNYINGFRVNRRVLINQIRHIMEKREWYVANQPQPQCNVIQLSLFD